MDNNMTKIDFLTLLSKNPQFTETLRENPDLLSLFYSPTPPTSSYTPTQQQTRSIPVDDFIEKFDELSKLSVKIDVITDKISTLEKHTLNERVSKIEDSRGFIQQHFTATIIISLIGIFIGIGYNYYSMYNNMYTIIDNKYNILNEKFLNITKECSSINQALSDNNIKINK